jgi:hypothetical protein
MIDNDENGRSVYCLPVKKLPSMCIVELSQMKIMSDDRTHQIEKIRIIPTWRK